MKNKAIKNYGIMSTNVNAGAIAVGDNSSAKNIDKGIKAKEVASIIDIIQNNISNDEPECVSEQINQLKKDIEDGIVKPKKAEGKLSKIIKSLNNSETIISKISSIVGTTAGILTML